MNCKSSFPKLFGKTDWEYIKIIYFNWKHDVSKAETNIAVGRCFCAYEIAGGNFKGKWEFTNQNFQIKMIIHEVRTQNIPKN